MALITYAPLVSTVKGSIGGITFQANTAGQIARARSRPRRSRTYKQHSSQSKLLVWLPQWRALDLATQQDWNALALAHPITDFYGRTRQLTGFNMYARVNSQLVAAYQAPNSTPPLWAPPDPLDTLSLNLTPGFIYIVYTPSPLPADIYWAIYMSPNIWRSATPFRQYMRFVIVNPTGFDSPVDITNPWRSTFYKSWPADVQSGQTIQVAVYTIDKNTGLWSTTKFASAQWIP
jgi:hypothetical protein